MNVERLPPIKHFELLNEDGEILYPGLPYERLVPMWNELCNRSTMQPDDLAAIFAVFLDCNISEILRFRPEQRMHALLRAHGWLPVSILFSSLDHRANSWTPAFPTSKAESHSLTLDMGLMEFNTAGKFVMSATYVIRLYRLDQEITVGEDLTCSDTEHGFCLHLDFSMQSKQKAKKVSGVLLMLGKEDFDHKNVKSRGVAFKIDSDSELGMQARFLASFDWTRHKTDEASPVCEGSVPIARLPNDYISSTRRLTLDMCKHLSNFNLIYDVTDTC